MNGGISFLYREQVLSSGDSGKPTVVPSRPEASEMIIRIRSTDPDEIMPPPDHGKPLSENEAKIIEQWIREGAEWGDHWSFEKPTRHEAPEVSDKTWSKNAIDPFILAKLESLQIQPSPPAQPNRLLRGGYLDLIGMPSSI